MADRVTAELRGLGLEVEEDDAGRRIGSNAGNLLCRVPGRTNGGTPLFLCAHLDTVPPQGPLEPVVEDGVVRNAGGTILGADNKSAVVAMIEAARRLVEDSRPHAGVELVFTPMEEVGLLGAGAFDHTRLEAELGFVYDQAAPIGDVILGAPYAQTMAVRFHGRPAHSGMVPEEGPLRDPGRGPRGRRPPARPSRRRDDRERRPDQRRQRAQHRPRSGASSRRRPARTTRASSPTSSRRCSRRSRSRRARRNARSRPK